MGFIVATSPTMTHVVGPVPAQTRPALRIHRELDPGTPVEAVGIPRHRLDLDVDGHERPARPDGHRAEAGVGSSGAVVGSAAEHSLAFTGAC